MIGETISHYRILGKLGGGGMGVVYEAEDLRLGRRVALKFLPEKLRSDATALERFQREARATSALSHPNIATIYDIESYQGRPFIVMELLEGQNLMQRIRERPMSVDEMLDVGIQIADALDAAHTQGIIHRDIKPGNVFINPRGQVKVLDFGLAKLVDQPLPERVGPGATRMQARAGVATDEETPKPDEPLTSMGVIAGTSFYMSPEQIRNEELDVRSDLFSLGVLLYEMATSKRPFQESNNVLTLAAILDKKPVSPLTLNPKLPEEFEAIIGKALEKDRAKRYQTAAEMRADLQALKRESSSGEEAGPLAKAGFRGPKVFRRASPVTMYVGLGVAAVLVMVLVVTAVWLVKRGKSAGPPPNTVAVLPFQNMDVSPSNDYLRLALADEIANILTYTPQLEVRPVTATRRYLGGDPQEAGKELHVGTVVSGRYIREGEKLTLTLEAINVASNRIVWQRTVTVPAKDLIEMQKQLAIDLRQGLLPVLSATGNAVDTATKPKNVEAYDLYLRSAAVPHDPAPNKEAIAMLERSVGLDATYAPAWDALGLRYYYDAQYSGGGERVFDRAGAAYERAVSLDANFLQASAHLARNWAERGELIRAYGQARELVKRRGDNAQAHFTLAYVLRYAGILDEATRECDIARGLDPGNYGFRSCAFAFFEMGEGARALEYLELDAGSEWSRNTRPAVLLRMGRTEEAADAAHRMSNDATWFGRVLQSCLDGRPASEINTLVLEQQPAMLAQRDPEFRYHQGALMAYCGQMDVAAGLIKSAIQQNYCVAQALEKDPALGSFRRTPEYEPLQKSADECEQRFNEGRKK